VEQQQPGIHHTERAARDRSARGQVVREEVAVTMPGAMQHGQGRGAESVVGVDAEHAAGRPGPLGQHPHRLAGAAAGVQAARAGGEAGLVQQPPGRGLPDPRLGAEPLVLP
jgi:hypothetical protein